MASVEEVTIQLFAFLEPLLGYSTVGNVRHEDENCRPRCPLDKHVGDFNPSDLAFAIQNSETVPLGELVAIDSFDMVPINEFSVIRINEVGKGFGKQL